MFLMAPTHMDDFAAHKCIFPLISLDFDPTVPITRLKSIQDKLTDTELMNTSHFLC